MKKRLISIIFVFPGIGLINSCSVNKGKESPKGAILKSLLSISEKTCANKCPNFTAEFFSGQKMIYTGISRVPLVGKYEFFIPAKLTENLLSEANRLKLSNLPDSLPSQAGEQRIMLQFSNPDGSKKQISAGVKSSNPDLSSFIQKLNQEVFEMITNQQGIPMPRD
jgi:hypothetical protein